eukprot:10269568-Alexandrium_andersonii.AAC.1
MGDDGQLGGPGCKAALHWAPAPGWPLHRGLPGRWRQVLRQTAGKAIGQQAGQWRGPDDQP